MYLMYVLVQVSMVIKWVILVLVSIYSLQSTFIYKSDPETNHHVFNELLDNLDNFSILYFPEYQIGGDEQNQRVHTINLHSLLGKDKIYFSRGARKNKDDNISHIYSFIKNRPYFKTIHYDDTIYKKKNMPVTEEMEKNNEKYEENDGEISVHGSVRPTHGEIIKYF